jgi:hypothetical protein
MCGDFSHGLINYNPRFFTLLQQANDYEILARWIWTSEEAKSYAEIELATLNRPFAAQDAWVNFLFRKRHRGPFQTPSDCVAFDGCTTLKAPEVPLPLALTLRLPLIETEWP